MQNESPAERLGKALMEARRKKGIASKEGNGLVEQALASQAIIDWLKDADRAACQIRLLMRRRDLPPEERKELILAYARKIIEGEPL